MSLSVKGGTEAHGAGRAGGFGSEIAPQAVGVVGGLGGDDAA